VLSKVNDFSLKNYSPANWFAPGRHGQVSRYIALGSLNPSGQYAFNSSQDCLSFNAWVSSWGATAQPCSRKNASWKIKLKSEDVTDSTNA
jgi:hypothetical protein